jgi:hypothetical protein
MLPPYQEGLKALTGVDFSLIEPGADPLWDSKEWLKDPNEGICSPTQIRALR